MEAEIKDSMVKRRGQKHLLLSQFLNPKKKQKHNLAIKAPDGSNKTRREDVESELLNYFQNLLSKPTINREEAISKITDSIPRLVQPEQSQAMMHPTSLEEVEDIVKSMATGKSPGSDDFTMDFYQTGWPILGPDIWEVVEESHTSKGILQAFNATFITLIPKVKGY
jgi:hypothetical protein